MFASSNIPIFNPHQNQENSTSLMAKKALTANRSQRKPLSDRSNNHTKENTSLKPQAVKQKEPENNVVEFDEPYCFPDESLHSEIEDTYEDIWAKEHRLSESDINAIVKAGVLHGSETPPLSEEIFKETFVPEEFPINDSGIADDYEDFDISLVEINDVSVPNFDFDDFE